MRVLVCDDDAGTRLIVKQLLIRELGCEVVESADGADGLTTLIAEQFDLAIVDINMPNLDGIEFVEAVSRAPRLKHIPIVMLTADRREEVVRRLVSLGVSDYIAKPLIAKVALAKLERIMKSIDPDRAASAGAASTPA